MTVSTPSAPTNMPVTTGCVYGHTTLVMPPPTPPYQPCSSSDQSPRNSEYSLKTSLFGSLNFLISPEPVVYEASPTWRGPSAVTQSGRIASTSSPARSSKPITTWLAVQCTLN